MGLTMDIHVHTNRYSACSVIEPQQLVRRAVRAGLDGLVITEHGRQWTMIELTELLESANEPHFLLLAGFEYASKQGDILIYGLMPEQVRGFPPGMPPGMAVERAHDLGAVCIAAHPTRACLGFDDAIFSIPFDAIEVQSVNLKEHEQRLAMQLAENTNLPPTAASDAHRIEDVGRYATEFNDPIQTMADLQECLKRGRFRPATLRNEQRIGSA